MEDEDATMRPGYPTTIWSEVARAGDAAHEQQLAALGSLLNRYYRPLQAHLAAKFLLQPGEAADFLHEFVRRKMLLSDLLTRANRDRGRFRAFLLTALDHFVIGEMRGRASQKRSPAGGMVSRDDPNHPLENDIQQEQQGVEEWAREVVAQALERMRTQCEAGDQVRRWQLFRARLLDPMLHGVEAKPYGELAPELGFESPSEAGNALTVAKRHFERALREVVAEYAGDDAEVEMELQALKHALANGG